MVVDIAFIYKTCRLDFKIDLQRRRGSTFQTTSGLSVCSGKVPGPVCRDTEVLLTSLNGSDIRIEFRYTLGGLYLARYTDSPVGAFDEVRSLPCGTLARPVFLHLMPFVIDDFVADGGYGWACLELSNIMCLGCQGVC